MHPRLLLLTLLLNFAATAAASAQTEKRSIEIDGRTRTFLLHVPTGASRGSALPLVFVFHGGGGQGAGTERLTRFSRLADRERFIVVYPDGLDRKWNDGRGIEGFARPGGQVDDVKFVDGMLETLAAERLIDRRRVFATGISNGAIFSHFLAAQLAPKIAAIAPVAGGIGESLARDFHPASPVSVLVIQGTLDPLVPFAGGNVARRGHGRIVSTNEAIKLWVSCDHCATQPSRGELPNRDSADHCRVRTSTWSHGLGGSEVTLFTIEGGGHTWPGGAQYLPKWLIGAVCRDFDAAEEIWSFFRNHPKG